jgi:hypothetical protein
LDGLGIATDISRVANVIYFLHLEEVLGILAPFLLFHRSFGILAHGGVVLEAGAIRLLIYSILFLDVVLLLHSFFSQVAFSTDTVLCFFNKLAAVSDFQILLRGAKIISLVRPSANAHIFDFKFCGVLLAHHQLDDAGGGLQLLLALRSRLDFLFTVDCLKYRCNLILLLLLRLIGCRTPKIHFVIDPGVWNLVLFSAALLEHYCCGVFFGSIGTPSGL